MHNNITDLSSRSSVWRHRKHPRLMSSTRFARLQPPGRVASQRFAERLGGESGPMPVTSAAPSGMVGQKAGLGREPHCSIVLLLGMNGQRVKRG